MLHIHVKNSHGATTWIWGQLQMKENLLFLGSVDAFPLPHYMVKKDLDKSYR
jgi:hypothetical protein